MDSRNFIPGVVQISITSRCQCNCKHCGVSYIKRKVNDEPSLNELDAIFADLKRSGTSVVDFFGGEPTIRKDLFEIIARAKSYGFITIIESNGHNLDEKYIIGLKNAGLNQVYLSLDDYSEEYHDSNRALKGLFSRVVNAFAFCRQHGLSVDASFVPKSEDYFKFNINDYLAFAFDSGADNVRILLPRFTGSMHLTGESPFSDGNEQKLIGYIAPQYLDRIYFHSNDTPLDDISVCSAKKYFCHILTNGDVLPCPYLPLVFGNIRKESISVIFNRIQNSEIMKSGGTHCLARNIDFVKKYLSRVTPEEPFIRMV
jgi:MoaA/NifB/PqqE/SkfB family radical SAM enzyme